VIVTEADFRASFGQRNDEILGAWLGPGADPERIRRIGDTKEECYRAMIERDGVAPLPGAAEWVRTLHGAGWRQAIASSAPRLNVEVMRRALGFEELIETWVGAEDVRAGKPDPEVFLTAAARLDVPPHRCIVVEDAAAGIEAARRGGMPSIGVGEGAAAEADLAVDSLAALPAGAFDMLLRSTAWEGGAR
jgi:beta-phosphoglucomutase